MKISLTKHEKGYNDFVQFIEKYGINTYCNFALLSSDNFRKKLSINTDWFF